MAATSGAVVASQLATLLVHPSMVEATALLLGSEDIGVHDNVLKN